MGIRGETVTDVSQRLLAHHGRLRGRYRLNVAELARMRGSGLRQGCANESDPGVGRAVGHALTLAPCAHRVCCSCQSRGRSVTRAFVFEKDGRSPRLSSRAIVPMHSLANRTFTT
jgi:hypothetical protein